MMRWTAPEVGDKIVDIVMSLNAQAVKRYDLKAVSANYSHKEPTLGTLEQIVEAAEYVERELASLPGHPGKYLRAMNRSHKTLARWMAKDGITYHEAVKNILEVDLKPLPQQKFEEISQRIDRQLTDWSYKGTVANKIADWQNDKRIPPEQVVAAANRYIDKMRKATYDRVRRLPETERIRSVNAIQGVFWSGLSEYNGDYEGQLTFNIDRPWNDPTFACILSHEAYPGHHTFYTWWDHLFLTGRLPLEASYYLIDSPTNCLFEGAPEVAIDFIGWDNPEEDTPEITPQEKKEIIVAKDIMDLQRMLQTQASYLYNVEGRPREETIHYMTKDGWYSQIEAENTCRYFTHGYDCIYYPCYYYGRWIVQQAFDCFPKERRQEFYQIIYDTPQTNSTLIAAIEQATGQPFDPFATI